MINIQKCSPALTGTSLNKSQKQISFGMTKVTPKVTQPKFKISYRQCLKIFLAATFMSINMHILNKKLEKNSVKEIKNPKEKRKHINVNNAAKSINTLIYQNYTDYTSIDKVSQNVTKTLDKHSQNPQTSPYSHFVKEVLQFVKENQNTPNWYSVHEFGSGWKVDENIQGVLTTAAQAMKFACYQKTPSEESVLNEKIEKAKEIMKNINNLK